MGADKENFFILQTRICVFLANLHQGDIAANSIVASCASLINLEGRLFETITKTHFYV